MRRFLIGSLVVFLAFLATGDGFTLAATCSPTGICRACSNCNYCKHCAKNGGTCSVCR